MKAAKKKSVDETFEENAEVSRTAGVRPKGTSRPKPGKPPPTKRNWVTRLPLLSKFQVVVFTVDTLVGLGLIYAFVEPPILQAHLMWVFGAVHVIAALPTFFHKRE